MTGAATSSRNGKQRFVSEPLEAILRQSGLTPDKVYISATRAGARGRYPRLTGAHPYVRQMQAATGLTILAVWARYRRLLVHIEQWPGVPLVWMYREHSGSYTSFHCMVDLPEVDQSALVGRPLSDLTNAIPLFANVLLGLPDERHKVAPGWLKVEASPRWLPF